MVKQSAPNGFCRGGRQRDRRSHRLIPLAPTITPAPEKCDAAHKHLPKTRLSITHLGNDGMQWVIGARDHLAHGIQRQSLACLVPCHVYHCPIRSARAEHSGHLVEQHGLRSQRDVGNCSGHSLRLLHADIVRENLIGNSRGGICHKWGLPQTSTPVGASEYFI